MQPTGIPDKDIPATDPGTLIMQYTPLLQKLAKRYKPVLDKTGSVDIEDLLQAGRIAIYNAQKNYNPNNGATFLTYAFNGIRGAMLYALGYKNGKIPIALEYLDEPLSDNGDDTRLDYIPDPSPTAEESIIEQDTRNETAEAVHAAISRLKSEKHREIITRVYINGQDRKTAAEEMRMKIGSFHAADQIARGKLKRDKRLQWFCMPMLSGGLKRFRETGASSVEEMILWKEKMTDLIHGNGYYAAERKENDFDN